MRERIENQSNPIFNFLRTVVFLGIIYWYIYIYIYSHPQTDCLPYQFFRRALHYASGGRQFLRQRVQPPWGSIYCHPQTDCFVLPELFSVARHAGRSKPGSKPIQLYVRLCFRPLGHQADHVGLGKPLLTFYYTLSATRMFNSFEELCITLASAGNSFARELNPHIYIYIYMCVCVYVLRCPWKMCGSMYAYIHVYQSPLVFFKKYLTALFLVEYNM